MMTQKQLFPVAAVEEFDKLPERLLPIKPQILGIYAEVMSDWIDSREHDPRFSQMDHFEAAQWIQSQLRDRVKAEFTDTPDVTLIYRGRQLILNYQDAVHITFKKLDSSLNRSNNRSRSSNDDYWTQSHDLSDGNVLKVIIGYRMSRDLLSFELFVTLPHGKGVASWLPFVDDAGGMMLEMNPVVPIPEENEIPRKGFHVKPKKDSSQKGRRHDAGG